MPKLAIFLLGPPRIELDGDPIHIGRRKVLALLAYLAITKQRHSRETLAAFLAPEFDSSGARTDLRRTLSLLNNLLGQGWLAADRDTVGLAPDEVPSASSGQAPSASSGQAPSTGFAQHPARSARTGQVPSTGSGQVLWLDVNRFRQCLGACQSHGHPLADACPRCVPLLEEAEGLYQGDFMAGFSLPDSLPFDEWQRFESEALHQELASAVEWLVRALSAQGEVEGAIPHARRWLELNLTHEPAHRALMELYARTGQTSAALQQYEYCVQTLAEELGVPPSPETVAMYERVRAGHAAESYSVSPDQVQQTPGVPHNLPPQPTPFLGREAELAELDQLFADPDVRLITIVGPGGIGKTRLALAAAERQLNQPTDHSPAVPQPSHSPALLFCAGKAGLRWEQRTALGAADCTVPQSRRDCARESRMALGAGPQVSESPNPRVPHQSLFPTALSMSPWHRSTRPTTSRSLWPKHSTFSCRAVASARPVSKSLTICAIGGYCSSWTILSICWKVRA